MSGAFLPDFVYWRGELLADHALLVRDGACVGVAPAAQAPGAMRLAGRALFPGLVNAHSHAFQRLIRGRTEYVAAGRAGDDFWSWREAMYRAAEALDPDGVFVASRQAFLEMALAGITAVGEFHYLHHSPGGEPYADPNELGKQVLRAAREVGIRVVLLEVAYARAGHQVAENPRQRRFIEKSPDAYLRRIEALPRDAKVGLAPHSVRAVPREWLEELARGRQGRVVHMHLSEQPAENRACLAEHGRTPSALIAEAGLLDGRFTGVHGVHLSADDLALLGKAGASICACPSTERNLGDGIVPARELLEAGARLCLGSDSQAHIDLLEEARQLEGHLRLRDLRRAVLDDGSGRADGVARRLLEVASLRGAQSLGLESGALEEGRPADCFTVDLGHPSVLGADAAHLVPAVLFGAEKAAIRDVAVGGQWIVRDGVHPGAERSAVEFQELTRKVFG